ncbi:MAG: sulfotransferase domain-containing protein [Thermodesulfobacteriota bacterium]
MKKGPDFIIIGAMKCATSTLHDQLAAHASFFMSSPKEPNFFSDDQVYEKGLGWYESLFAEAGPDQLRGESSTHYTKLPIYPQALPRLVDYCSGAMKCIYVMRQPVERLISHYIHEWTQGVYSCEINQAVKRYPEMVEYGCYYRQLQPYLAMFGRESVLPMFAERLRADPRGELQRVFDFLGVAEEPPVWRDDIRSNISAERLRHCPWRDALVDNSLLAWLRRTLVPKELRKRVRQLWTMDERPQLSKGIRREVEEVFNRDLEDLGLKLGLDLDCAGFRAQVVAPSHIGWVGEP